MKKYNKIKTIQLVVYITITLVGLVYIFNNEDLYHMIAANTNLKVFFGIMWILLFVSFVFMYVDFSAYANLEREYKELDLTIFSDPVTGMANRSSCDAFIEQYLDKPLPEDIGCITFDITNLSDINKQFGYVEGNAAIREFSVILQAAAMDVCFVGRNGGNKFLAIFRDCSLQKMDDFLSYVESRVAMRNVKAGNSKIRYEYGVAFQEGDSVTNINQLIALANRRTIEAYRTFVDRGDSK
jgi:diguanylate cyclase (GGDEF)-like protein